MSMANPLDYAVHGLDVETATGTNCTGSNHLIRLSLGVPFLVFR